MRAKRSLKMAGDDPGEYHFNILRDEEVEMMHLRVMYGYRIAAGYVNSRCYEWNWCCGDNSLLISITYGVMKTLLEAGVNFHELPPFSDIKPYNKDEKFMKKLDAKLKEISDVEFIELLKIIGLYQPLKIEEDETR